MHSEYKPGAEPASHTPRMIDDDDTYTDVTLATPLVGVAHAVDDITNACASALTFTSPTPLSVTATLPHDCSTGITLGVAALKPATLNEPTA